MSEIIGKLRTTVAVVLLSFFVPLTAIATEDVTEDVTIDFSGGARAETIFDTTDDTSTFAIDNVRLVADVDTSYGIDANIGVQYDGTSTNNIDILAASLSVDVPIPFVSNAKVGRFLAPQDRAGLAGDYGQITWNLPTVVSKYPSVNGYGRQDGVAISGGIDDVVAVPVDTGGVLGDSVSLNYTVGAFQGINGGDDTLVAGRVVADVGNLNVAFAFQTQDDAFSNGRDFFGWNVDGAYSKKIGPGTAIVNAGYYDYDLDGASYVPGTGQNQGNGGYVLGAYTLDAYAFKVGALSITPQPFVQYQEFDFGGTRSGDQERWDVGANFILNADTNTKLTVSYFNDELVGDTNEGVIAGIQFAF
jgi:hypothetical protein